MNDFIITLLFGWLGVHKFKQKKYGMGILYLCTLGLFFIGWWIDTIVAFVKMLKGEQQISENQLSQNTQGVSGQPKEFTKPQLEGMKKADILEMATGLGYTMTTIERDTKDRIIADFIAQQEKQPSLMTKKWLIKTLSTEIVGTFADCDLSRYTREEVISSLKPNSILKLEYWEYEGEPAYYVCNDRGDDAGCIPATLAKRLHDVYSDCDIVVELDRHAWHDARNDIR